MFLRNEHSLAVKNGTLGTVERLDANGRRVAVALKDYAQLEHGYAATVHNAQEVTMDQAHVLAEAWTRLERRPDGLVRLVDRPQRQAVEARMQGLALAIHRD